MTPWINMRDEGRAGDSIDPTILETTNWVDLPSDFRDKGTPDDWIPRDGRMVRLTGRHPFNSEPPVQCLTETGFLTPGNLHIIRNHGAVPQLDWKTHQLVVDGPLVTKPLTLSMDVLTTEFPTTEFPVSISCCGNRRKEMNMIKQTIGFNWGSAAVGTMVYKGVLLRDLLIAAGIDTTNLSGKYVEFIGTDDLPNKSGGPGPFEDEPWGDKVKYGTSIPLAKCMDPADEVMVAFQANGERLHPDRGYPVRLVIPGYIGGRMIKWLAKIRVIPHESKNCYHYWDNKYMPPQVTAEIAAADGWWYKQEYIINELSLNSLICTPNHDDFVPLSASNIDKPFEISGYAHSGGGRMVTRVEVSTDKGATWELATIKRTEQPNPYGKYWCWIWWTYQVPAVASLDEEIWCRAWDTSNSPQPHTPTWTLMGQSSNHIFRVKVRTDKDAKGQVGFRFDHPTRAGQQSGGWATKLADKVKHAGYGMISLGEE
jgi:nitrate reductase (NAD(P)H)